MDLVVDGFVNSDFCDQVGGDERCPDILDAVLRQGLPLLAAASNPDDFKAVEYHQFRSQFLETAIPPTHNTIDDENGGWGMSALSWTQNQN